MAQQNQQFQFLESNQAIELVPRWDFELWWLLVGLLVLGLLIFVVGKMVKNVSKPDPLKQKKKLFETTRVALAKITSKSSRETAISISFLLRKYLAETMNEPALYETHEEFVSRNDALKLLPDTLKKDLGSFFSELSRCKYASEETNIFDGTGQLTTATSLLERIHRA